MIRILALDGGGIRGLVPALLLDALETRAGRPIAELFDFVAGTSTGAILALGLTCPGDAGRPRFRARELVNFYRTEGPCIFSRTRLRTLRTVNGLLGAKYDNGALDQALHDRFGGTMLSAALRDLLIPTYDIHGRRPYFFKSADIRSGAAADHPMRMVALAAAAPPTYLRPVRVTDSHGDRWLIDGGVVANNPALCAYAEVMRYSPGANVLIVSIGCGSLSTDFAQLQILTGGAIAWARPLLDIVLDAAEDTTDYCLRQLLPPARYFRFQATLGDSAGGIDDVRAENLDMLETCAGNFLMEHAAELSDLVSALSSSNPVQSR